MGAFDGLAAIVTGGASGIGEAIVNRLREDGARVAIFDRQVHDGLTDAYRVDVTDDESVRAGVEKVAADFGGIDVVVNNAGIGAQGTVETNDDDEWHRVFDVNVVGAVRVSRAALPHLRDVERRGDRQHLLDRRDGRPARARAVRRDQRRDPVAHAAHGGGSPARRDPRQLREPRNRRHALGRAPARLGTGSGR